MTPPAVQLLFFWGGIIGNNRPCRLVLIWRRSCIECVTVRLLGPENGQTNRIFPQLENEKKHFMTSDNEKKIYGYRKHNADIVCFMY